MKLLYIGNKLSKHGNSNTIIESLGYLLETEGYEIIYSSSKKNQILRLLDMIVTTFLSFKKVKYVLIDTYSTSSFYYTLVISQMCRILNLKYIPILHGGKLPNRIEKSKFLSNLIFKNSFINCAPSNYLMQSFYKNGYNNLVYIPNTIEINNYPFLERKILEPKLLWVRSFSKIYNPKMAIDVLASLKKEFPNAQLAMVGPDKENILENFKKYAQSLNVNVEFLGKLSKEDWVTLSKEYSIFINTTHFDNTPVSVIEVMALGIPVVSTNVGGIPYLLNDTIDALLVNDNDTNAMVSAIKKLILNSEFASSITTNARKKVEAFDWEIVKLKWIEILK